MYTSLGVITKGTIIEVNISELGLVTSGGKVGIHLREYICTVNLTRLFQILQQKRKVAS